jgi:flagellum-specific ATP synthase
VLDSISRLMPAVASADHLSVAAGLRRAMALYDRSSDLIRIGAYKPGTDPDLDRAISLQPAIRVLLTQSATEKISLGDVERALIQMGNA